uniref:NADH-ubiquinone oxidoreductase chain 4L n=1 Tax=Gehyra marginata TaxID=1074251 RepID=A0A7R7G1T9_9SAUR|nr:NADH dehydrogenase 4L [Gehyra marginata]
MTIINFAAMTSFILATTGLTLHRKHLVSALLCIEGMVLALFLSLSTISQTLAPTTLATQPIIMLTIAACGACTGLALLVAATRTHASDHLKTMNLLKC